jgi:hypothetical protein
VSRAQDDKAIERPLDRLSYYNGQRLEARDLKLEQAYHMRMRRWLNKSLYPDGGIVNGLEVIEQEGTLVVIVTAGLALDTQGREIILLEDTQVQWAGNPGECILTIRYDEHTTGCEQDGCTTRSEAGARAAGSSLAWSGPALVRAEPVFAWRDALPLAASDEIALARVMLDDDCQVVKNVDLSGRDLMNEPGDTVHQFALEGFRDIDEDNPGRIYFHIRGRQPTAVTLYLRAEPFSTLYYSELGYHDHKLSNQDPDQDGPTETTGSPTEYPEHNHETPITITKNDLKHSHAITLPLDKSTNTLKKVENQGEMCFEVVNKDAGYFTVILTDEVLPGYTFDVGDLSLDTLGSMLSDPRPLPDHQHELSLNLPEMQIEHSGTHIGSLFRRGEALTYVKNLQVWIDGKPRTEEILKQAQDNLPGRWTGFDSLGNGQADHPLVKDDDPTDVDGTGPINLHLLGIPFTEGEHYIDLRIPASEDGAGGRISYNLYVE